MSLEPVPSNFQEKSERLELPTPKQNGMDAASLLLRPISELFSLAQQHATRSNFAAKEFIYEQVIRLHPEATPLDITRLDIAAADRQRRSGNSDVALLALEKIKLPAEPNQKDPSAWATANCDLLAAKAWALFHSSCQDGDATKLRSAVLVADEAAIFAKEHRYVLPAERLCQALEGAIGVRVSGRVELDAVAPRLQEYRVALMLIDDAHLRSRALNQYFAVQTETHLMQSNHTAAIETSTAYLKAAEEELGGYYKLGAAIQYLVALHRAAHPDLHSTRALGLAEYVAEMTASEPNTRDIYLGYLSELAGKFDCIAVSLKAH